MPVSPKKPRTINWTLTRRLYNKRPIRRTFQRAYSCTWCYFAPGARRLNIRAENTLMNMRYGSLIATRKQAIHKRKSMGQKGPSMLNRSPRTLLWAHVWPAHPQYYAQRALYRKHCQTHNRYDPINFYLKHHRAKTHKTLGYGLHSWNFFAPCAVYQPTANTTWFQLFGAPSRFRHKTILKWRTMRVRNTIGKRRPHCPLKDHRCYVPVNV